MGSLKDSIDLGDWVQSCILQFKSPKYYGRQLFVLEGKSDIGFYRNLFTDSQVYFDSPCGGKFDVIESVRKLKERGMEDVLGVCDADFDHLLQCKYPNVLVTDVHDIEMMMLSKEFILTFFHDYTKHTSYTSDSSKDLCDNIMMSLLDSCYKIGILKLINIKYGIGLNFKGMTYDKFIKINEFKIEFDAEAYISHILDRSRDNVEFDFVKLYDLYNKYYDSNYDKEHICNGHDFTYLLSMVYKGEHSQDRNIKQDHIERFLRATYTHSKFMVTELGKSLHSLIYPATGDSKQL